jgi:hypothetical protein
VKDLSRPVKNSEDLPFEKVPPSPSFSAGGPGFPAPGL